MLIVGLVLAVTVLYRVSLPAPLPTHRLVWGALLATAVFVVTTAGLRIYLRYITRTGYTYGALAAPIAFLLFAFFLGRHHDRRRTQRGDRGGMARPEPHWHQWRARLRGESATGSGSENAETTAETARWIARRRPSARRERQLFLSVA